MDGQEKNIPGQKQQRQVSWPRIAFDLVEEHQRHLSEERMGGDDFQKKREGSRNEDGQSINNPTGIVRTLAFTHFNNIIILILMEPQSLSILFLTLCKYFICITSFHLNTTAKQLLLSPFLQMKKLSLTKIKYISLQQMAFLGANSVIHLSAKSSLLFTLFYFHHLGDTSLERFISVFLSLCKIVSHYILSADIINRCDEEVYCVIMKGSITYDSNYYSLAFDENKLCATVLYPNSAS